MSEPAAPTKNAMRLAQSRHDIALWLRQDAEAHHRRPGAGGSARGSADGSADRKGSAAPMTGSSHLARLALSAVAEGLLRRPPGGPARMLLNAAGDSGNALLVPVASRHPWALVAVAALAGAALVAGKPWRWLLRPTLLGSLVSPLLIGAITRAALASRPEPRPPAER